MNYNTVKRFYSSGLWSLNMVKMAVRKCVITREQYREITGAVYG